LIRRPDAGTFLEKTKSSFILVEKEKPYIWTKWTYRSSEDAARGLIRKRCDPSFLKVTLPSEGFISVESS
jgi:hypothetical protein